MKQASDILDSTAVVAERRMLSRSDSLVRGETVDTIETEIVLEDGTVIRSATTQPVGPDEQERRARHARLIAYTEDRKSDPIIVDIIRELLER